MNSANIFLRTRFFGTPPVAASVKAHNFTKIGLRQGVFSELSKKFWNVFLMRCKNFLEFHKNTGKNMFPKYLSEDDCFVKTIVLTVMITTMLSVS